MSDVRKSLQFALDKYPERVEVVPIAELAVESARQNAKRPAYIKVAVPDEVVKALRGSRESDHLTLVVHLPREVIERSESAIVLPGEVG